MNEQSSTEPVLRISIVGRPNVGKSTLFNRLLGRKRALVHNLPGVTRDRLEEDALWWHGGKQIKVSLIDTGGIGGEVFDAEIRQQVGYAFQNSDIVVAVFDGRTGLVSADDEAVDELRKAGILSKKSKIPCLGVINKVDQVSDDKTEGMISEFYSTGIENLTAISAEHNHGIETLKEKILFYADILEPKEVVPETDTEKNEGIPKIPKIAIVGKPNVGKSTLLNALFGQERMITSPVPGTTVDSVDTEVVFGGKPMVLIDTAGIRKKSKTEEGVEVLSVVQAKKALDRADLALLVIDGELGLTDQDEKIGGLIQEAGCCVIIIVNKWDTQASKSDFSKEDASERVRGQMAYLNYAPILFTSGLKKTGLKKLPELIQEVLTQKDVKLATPEFTRWVRKESEVHNPMEAKFYLCHQSGRHPPTFICHVNDPKKIHFSLERHLINAMRERWGYMGSPVRLHFVQRKKRHFHKHTELEF